MSDLESYRRSIDRVSSATVGDAAPVEENPEVLCLLDRICARLKGWIADLLRVVKRVLASLATPKEWSVKVKAGVAGLEVKFGA